MESLQFPQKFLVPPKVAVLLPCLNEAGAVGETIQAFQQALPQARVYVFDNGSHDGTIVEAQRAGAIVRTEYLRGKGNVVRRMFADIDADIYVLADGDGTYDAEIAPDIITQLRSENLDMISCKRASEDGEVFRRGHRFGTYVLTKLVGALFGGKFTDLFSGYRFLSRRFVKSFPAHSVGFEIETELTVHALEMRLPMREIEARYHRRPDGTKSKLRTYRDGWLITLTIFNLLRNERPFFFFSCTALLLFSIAVLLAYPILITYIETGLVPRLPTAVLCTGLVLLGFISLFCGVILDAVTKGRKEQKRYAYLFHTPVEK